MVRHYEFHFLKWLIKKYCTISQYCTFLKTKSHYICNLPNMLNMHTKNKNWNVGLPAWCWFKNTCWHGGGCLKPGQTSCILHPTLNTCLNHCNCRFLLSLETYTLGTSTWSECEWMNKCHVYTRDLSTSSQSKSWDINEVEMFEPIHHLMCI